MPLRQFFGAWVAAAYDHSLGYDAAINRPAAPPGTSPSPSRASSVKEETPLRFRQQMRLRDYPFERGSVQVLRRRSEKTKWLQTVPLFKELSHRQISQIGRLVTEIMVSAGTRLATAGEYGRELVIIVEGRATVTVDRKRTVSLGPGDFWGEMSLVDGGPRSATVEAATDMRLLAIEDHEFSRLLQTAPLIAIKIMQVLSQRVRNAEASYSL